MINIYGNTIQKLQKKKLRMTYKGQAIAPSQPPYENIA